MTPFCQADIEADEGFRAQAYPDPLSGAEPWTVGYGATGPDIGPSTVWTQPQAATWTATRISSLSTQLAQAIPCWIALVDARQDVLVNMAYQLGLSGLLAFKQTLAYINAGEYAEAGAAMLDSKWATQVPTRAQRLATQMETGVRVGAE